MIKAKEFFDLLCKKLEYRFFTGLPFDEAKSLFSGMSSEFMHYIPATKASSALGMAYGVKLSGFKPCLILPKEEVSGLDFYLPLNILIITNGIVGIKSYVFSGDLETLEDAIRRSDKLNYNIAISLEEA